ncbi:RCE1 [Candida metapsilosis]|uniref:intramembrane prenyl-peptidase Rce1 n=1 Tax=Candida metapsilosis TaxID=273372 RepID=A0A8H7ZE06_9ASCO|nr:RCE1 [Candida metapsilosis]
MIYEVLTLAIASSYVFAIYFRQPRYLQNKDRNDVQVIRYRLSRVTLLCVGLIIIIPLLIPGPFDENLRQIGLIPGFTSTRSLSTDIANVLYSFKFINILFASTIFQILVEDFHSTLQDISTTPLIHHFRDYVFAPVTEELIYRGLILLVVTNTCPDFIKYTPYLFGIAHFHHALQLYKKHSLAMSSIVVSTLFQFTYTSIFGYLANWIYLKTDFNLFCPIIIHSFCNFYGFPTLRMESDKLVVHLVYYALVIGGLYHTYVEIAR